MNGIRKRVGGDASIIHYNVRVKLSTERVVGYFRVAYYRDAKQVFASSSIGVMHSIAKAIPLLRRLCCDAE